MSWFRNAAGLVALIGVAMSLACGSSPSTTAPSAATFTDTFSGTVLQGGSNKDQNHFTVHQAPGSISVTITKLAPLSTITIGLGLGVYDATNQVCNLQLLSDTAKLNLVLSANVSVAGELCVGLYDVGNIVDSIDFEVSVTHT